MRQLKVVFLALIYSAACWQALSIDPALHVGPDLFMVLFLISVIVGFFLIVLQVDQDTGDDGREIVLLSGKHLPAVTESAEQKEDDQRIQSWVSKGKLFFFFLSIFLLVFWFRLTLYGLPKEWIDKGYYTFMILLYAFGEAGKNFGYAREAYSYGDNMLAVISSVKMGFALSTIGKPVLLSIPYVAFVYRVMRGHSLLSEYKDPD